MNIEKDIKIRLVKGDFNGAKRLLIENERHIPRKKYQKLYAIINKNKIRSDRKYNELNRERDRALVMKIMSNIVVFVLFLISLLFNNSDISKGILVLQIIVGLVSIGLSFKNNHDNIKYLVSKRSNPRNRDELEDLIQQEKRKPLIYTILTFGIIMAIEQIILFI